MCGRFTNRLTWREIVALYRLTDPPFNRAPNLQPRFNIAPTQDVPVVRPKDGGRELAMLVWGLIPFWAKDRSIGAKMINARAETVAEKPAFRDAFRKRRCLIPADGFYEWRTEGKAKQPYLFTLPDGAGFAFAGLWERWDKEGEPVESCTIITTTANDTVRPVHPRMPVILSPENYGSWLDPAADGSGLLKPYAGAMRCDPASRAVNNAKNEGPELVEPIEAPSGPLL